MAAKRTESSTIAAISLYIVALPYIYYIFPKQVFGPKTLRRCTKTVSSDAFLFATHVFWPFSCVAVRVWTTVTFLGGNMTQWSVNSMLNSVFSDLCVDYGPGNDTVVLGSPVKPGMTVLSL